jgi:hypothetical protein
MLGCVIFYGERRHYIHDTTVSKQIAYLSSTLADQVVVTSEKCNGLEYLPSNCVKVACGYPIGDAGRIQLGLLHIPADYELLICSHLNVFSSITLPEVSSLYVEKSADFQNRWDTPLYINNAGKPFIYLGSSRRRCEVEPAELSFANLLYLTRRDTGLFRKLCKEKPRLYLWEIVNILAEQSDLTLFRAEPIRQFTTAKTALL